MALYRNYKIFKILSIVASQLSYLSKFKNKKGFYRAVFGIKVLKANTKVIFSKSYCCFGRLTGTLLGSEIFLLV